MEKVLQQQLLRWKSQSTFNKGGNLEMKSAFLSFSTKTCFGNIFLTLPSSPVNNLVSSYGSLTTFLGSGFSETIIVLGNGIGEWG